jgi:hypothetical protein
MRAFLGRKQTPRALHPDEWSEQAGRPRVLIENPDGADLWAHADVLREAGYEVAMCGGPTVETRNVPWFRRRPLPWGSPSRVELDRHTLCPLLSEGHCPLVEGADVVVSTTQLTDGREIIAKLSAKTSPAVVVEGTSFDLERDRDVVGDSVELELPVLPHNLVEAVERARGGSSA